jgi:hypothetical protein
MDARAKLRRLITVTDGQDDLFAPTPLQISRAYNILNDCLFGGKLKKPYIIIKNMQNAWALCEGDIYTGEDRFDYAPVCRRIILTDQFPNRKFFLEVLAHEMIHQYQCEVQNRMDHGQTFWVWKNKLERYNLRLFKSKAGAAS